MAVGVTKIDNAHNRNTCIPILSQDLFGVPENKREGLVKGGHMGGYAKPIDKGAATALYTPQHF
jgi:hypothetical protein